MGQPLSAIISPARSGKIRRLLDRANARRAVALAALYGTLHIRALADVDSKAKLEGVKAFWRARRIHGIVDIQVVAFAQDGMCAIRHRRADARSHGARLRRGRRIP